MESEQQVVPQGSAKPAGGPAVVGRKIDRARLMEIQDIYSRYRSGLEPLYEHIKQCEEWWRQHNDECERSDGTVEIGKDGGFVSRSSWLVNVCISKHADAMDAMPEPVILPREESDQQTATALSKVLPCVLELNGIREVWSGWKWRKLRHGGGVVKTTWDRSKHNGLGDISVQSVNVLNLAWKPTVGDIQDSPYVFHAEYVDRAALAARYPQVELEQTTPEQIASFRQDKETEDLRGMVTVVECYYKVAAPTGVPGVSRNILHYLVYTGNTVLYASEDDPDHAVRGWYDHGLYPYDFDILFPKEGSVWGMGYIDIGRNAQTKVDLLDTAMIKNAMVGAIPRYLKRSGGGISTDAFLDLNKAVIEVDGDISEVGLREVPYKPLEGNHIALRDAAIQELRETTGNTESSTGNSGSGVTAASAIAALQEASGKVSRDENAVSYEVFSRVCRKCIELMRQFYDLPRTFRITGQTGAPQFISFDNRQLKPRQMMGPGGTDGGLRRPEFDVIVSAQKATPYARMAQNELALQFYDKGFFDPTRAEQAIMCLEMMDFQGKDTLLGKIQKNAMMHQKLVQYAQLALSLAPPEMQQVIARDITATLGGQAAPIPGGAAPALQSGEPRTTAKARERAQAVTQPQGG